jgi:hypothetical protein
VTSMVLKKSFCSDIQVFFDSAEHSRGYFLTCSANFKILHFLRCGFVYLIFNKTLYGKIHWGNIWRSRQPIYRAIVANPDFGLKLFKNLYPTPNINSKPLLKRSFSIFLGATVMNVAV